MSYYRARSLTQLVHEVDDHAPRRSRRTDGWVGDKAHASRDSDHNPANWPKSWTGPVRAQDITHDPAGGLDCNWLADVLADQLGKHPALGPGAYIIFNHQIISTDRLSEGWRPYNGRNGHTHHLHLSVGRRGFDNTTPFLEDDMPTPDEIAKAVLRAKIDNDGTTVKKALRRSSKSLDAVRHHAARNRAEIAKIAGVPEAAVDAVLDAIEAGIDVEITVTADG